MGTVRRLFGRNKVGHGQQNMVHLYVAFPAYSCQVNKEFATSLFNLQATCIRNRVACTIDSIGNESLVHRARNILTARFMKNETATHLVFIDADIAFNPESIFKLVNANKPIISGVYAKKGIQWENMQKRVDEWCNKHGKSTTDLTQQQLMEFALDYNINIQPGKSTEIANGIAPVLDTATGFLVIQRETLEKMCAHYKSTLTCVNDIPTSGQIIPEYVAVFDCMIDKTNLNAEGKGRYLSEDFAFSRRWQMMDPENNEIYVDLSIPLGHVGSHQFCGTWSPEPTTQSIADAANER
jgi:hypothetical protein